MIASVVSAALLVAQPMPAATLEGGFYSRVHDLVERRRFFDAHVSCLTGMALAPTDEARTSFAVLDGFSLWMLGDRDEAFHVLNRPASSISDRELLSLTAAWLQIKGGNETPLVRWVEKSQSDTARRAVMYLDALHGLPARANWPKDLAQLARAYHERPVVSPLWTGALSALVPGAGHARLGLWGDAAVALTLNTVSIGATAELVHSRLVLPALAAGLVASLFYVGAMVSSANLADERNRIERERRLTEIDSILFPELPIVSVP